VSSTRQPSQSAVNTQNSALPHVFDAFSPLFTDALNYVDPLNPSATPVGKVPSTADTNTGATQKVDKSIEINFEAQDMSNADNTNE
jgi:hypothetical protein